MNNYRELSNQWEKQSTSQNLKPTNFQPLKRGNRVTIAVLSVTVLILLAYAVYVFNPELLIFDLGLLIMIGSVSTRIILEILSLLQSHRLKPENSMSAYHSQLHKYHAQRLSVHRVWTPVLLTMYWTGFVLLIPTFHEYLTNFMFNYVCISSIPVAGVMIWLIARQIRKEKAVLDQIIEDLSGV
jgi:hypothetical protein